MEELISKCRGCLWFKDSARSTDGLKLCKWNEVIIFWTG